MEKEPKPLTEGQLVVTITDGTKVPKVLRVTIKDGVYYDKDFISNKGKPNKPTTDYFGDSSGIIPRDKVYDKTQLYDEHHLVNSTISALMDSDDIKYGMFEDTYKYLRTKNVERPEIIVTESQGKPEEDRLAEDAADWFKLLTSIEVMLDFGLSREKYQEVYSKIKQEMEQYHKS